MKQIPVIRYCSQYINTSDILLLCFFAFSSRSFFLSKVLVLSIPSFISCCLYPQLTCSVIYHNFLGIHYLLSRRGEDVKLVKMVSFVLKTQGVLIYDVNKPVNRILSCRAWFPVYLIVFYKRQYLRNLSLY